MVRKKGAASGFTIVELLIVVIVIGILAAITIVSYNGIVVRANQTKLIADTRTAGTLMAADYGGDGSYVVSRSAFNGGKGLNNTADITYTFYSTESTYCITAISTHIGVDAYYVSDKNTAPLKGSCPQDSGAQVITLAGSGASGYANGSGTAAILAGPVGIVSDPSSGNLFFTDAASARIRMITPAGVVSTIAGGAGGGYAENPPGPAALFTWPQSLTVGPGGLLYVADTNNNRIRSVTQGGTTALVSGDGTAGQVNGAAASSRFRVVRGIVYNPVTNLLYIADSENNQVRTLTTAGVSSAFAGQTSGGLVNGTGAAAKFNYPQGLDVDNAGNIFVADTRAHTIRKITPAGVVTQIAGGGTTTFGQAGNVDAVGTTARFNGPMGVAVDSNGIIYVADTGNNSIRKITTDGAVTTIAGSTSGTAGYSDGGKDDALFKSPQGIAIGNDNRLYVTDTTNNRIRVISNP